MISSSTKKTFSIEGSKGKWKVSGSNTSLSLEEKYQYTGINKPRNCIYFSSLESLDDIISLLQETQQELIKINAYID